MSEIRLPSGEFVPLPTQAWRSLSILGQTVQMDGEPRVVIGILPREFHFLDAADPDVVLPLRFDRAKTRHASRPEAAWLAASMSVSR